LKEVILESSPWFVILCALAGVGYGFLLYTSTYPWSKQVNWFLFTLRSVVVFLLAFLLLGPIVKQINNQYEKPVFVVLRDDSGSMREASDSSSLLALDRGVQEIKKQFEKQGYDVRQNNLEGEEIKAIQYKARSSDLTAALKRIGNRYEGNNIAGVLLVSDGIYNGGVSPLYASYNFPITTVGVGDTAQRIDLLIKNLAYNKIVYQGNKFPVRVEVLVSGLPDQPITVSLSQRGEVLERQSQNSGGHQLLTFDFEVLAKEQGIQKYDIKIDTKQEERNTKNNRASAFIEVVEGKKKVLIVAAAPHPDIKAFREVVEKNSNYEFLLHIPGLAEQPADQIRPDRIDLAIFYQSPDVRGKTRDLFQQFLNSKTSLLVTFGQQSDLPLLTRSNLPVRFLSPPREYDEVTPIVNVGFPNFELTSENNAVMAEYPPVSVHFGKLQLQPGAISFLFQRVGSMTTDKPLLSIATENNRKVAVLLGEGIWRWRLNEFDRTDNTAAFDELFGKLIQYLSTAEDKRKFKSYPTQQEFSDVEPVIIESQVYNDIYEPVYGNTIDIDVTDERGKKTSYTYVTSPGNIRYSIGGLKEGVYRYRSKTTVQGKAEEVKGEFAIVEKQTELQNLTADFDLLRRLSSNTGGKFYRSSQLPTLQEDLKKIEAKSVIHTEEHYESLINLKWIFAVLLGFLAAEWFLRKYMGSY